MIGSSAKFRALLDEVNMVAPAHCSVLVHGETGIRTATSFFNVSYHWPGVGLLLKRLSREAALLLGKTPAAMSVGQDIIGVAAGVYVLVCGRR